MLFQWNLRDGRLDVKFWGQLLYVPWWVPVVWCIKDICSFLKIEGWRRKLWKLAVYAPIRSGVQKYSELKR